MTDEEHCKVQQRVRSIVRRLGTRSALRVTALVRTKVDRRRIVYQRMDASLEDLGLPIARTEIPLTATFQTAAAEHETVCA